MNHLPKPIAQNLAILLPILLLSLSHIGNCKPNTAVRTVQCNTGTYTKGDPFTISLAYVLDELESVTPTRQGYDFHNVSPYPNAFAYGHAACNQTLTRSDCAACLASSKTAVLGGCDSRIGARVVLKCITFSLLDESTSQSQLLGNRSTKGKTLNHRRLVLLDYEQSCSHFL